MSKKEKALEPVVEVTEEEKKLNAELATAIDEIDPSDQGLKEEGAGIMSRFFGAIKGHLHDSDAQSIFKSALSVHAEAAKQVAGERAADVIIKSILYGIVTVLPVSGKRLLQGKLARLVLYATVAEALIFMLGFMQKRGSATRFGEFIRVLRIGVGSNQIRQGFAITGLAGELLKVAPIFGDVFEAFTEELLNSDPKESLDKTAA